MAIIVQKYGGSSVADIEKLASVADQVVATKRAGHDVVVVVSAMGKTTDNLLALARQAAGSGAEPPRRELDMLLSTGERVSMSLLSIAISARGYAAVSFTGSQSGIITNDRHFDARIIEVRPHRIEDELDRGRIVIVAGYQGMSYKREITTLGRGGSDTTALALAAALGAERAEIYSDVDGVYTADPRLIGDARHLPALDWETMQEMAECGAKVLNAQAVEWAKRSRIAIHARQTGSRSERETIVAAHASDARPRAIVLQKQIALAHFDQRELAAFTSAASELGLPLGDLSTANERARVWIPCLNVPDFPALRRALEQRLQTLAIDEGLSLLSLVGVEVGARPEVVAAALAALPCEPRSLASSALRVSVVIDEANAEAAARAWHAALVSGDAQSSRSNASPGSESRESLSAPVA